MMRALILLLALASAVLAQPEPKVISVTVSRQLNVQPDKVSLNVTVFSDPNQTLDDVLTFLQKTKITAADLSNLYTIQLDNQQEWEWTFTPTISFSDVGAVVAALNALPALLIDKPITLWSFYVNATASPQAIAAQACPYPSLINDAQAQASKLAAAAGVVLGPIQSMEEPGTATPFVGEGFASPSNSYAYLVYDPNLTLVRAVGRAQPCSLTVDFRLGQ
jgi:hypothetical protein